MDLRAKLLTLKAEAEYATEINAVKRALGSLIEALLVEVVPAPVTPSVCYHCGALSTSERRGVPVCLPCAGGNS